MGMMPFTSSARSKVDEIGESSCSRNPSSLHNIESCKRSQGYHFEDDLLGNIIIDNSAELAILLPIAKVV